MVLATVQNLTRRTRTRWYRVITAHVANGQTIIDGINVEVTSGGHYGWGEQAAIVAHVSEHYPDLEVVDTWAIAA
ncbi:hypothetical protein H6F75_27165 [Nodosilinea sp. FACHB-131]|uniref:BON domain-containing protein n=1 Tax=Leptolyngbya subtilissima DQ-A4 TaxID=2933933 RepID=A0ABV0KAF3_9CYAN|nr:MULTISPECIES: hypothetical protein [unclassified Nodosilinea]MBD1877168.1 hypothetical protein [Nodosilinea sp. FACHB-131]MBD2115237.1 hypothetical protein [Nodosilinea sp. FACHB-141]